MNKTKIIIIIITLLLIFLINKYSNKTYNYLSIGDELSKYDTILYEDIKTITDKSKYNKIEVFSMDNLINDIYNNKKYGEITIQNLIYNANIITISFYYDNLDISKLDNLFSIIRKYNNKKIIITNFYSFNKNVNIDNYKLANLCKKYNITYIDINEIFQNNKKMFYLNYPYPNKDVYKLISKQVIKHVKK